MGLHFVYYKKLHVFIHWDWSNASDFSAGNLNIPSGLLHCLFLETPPNQKLCWRKEQKELCEEWGCFSNYSKARSLGIIGATEGTSDQDWTGISRGYTGEFFNLCHLFSTGCLHKSSQNLSNTVRLHKSQSNNPEQNVIYGSLTAV